jgi:hypothetical protein
MVMPSALATDWVSAKVKGLASAKALVSGLE